MAWLVQVTAEHFRDAAFHSLYRDDGLIVWNGRLSAKLVRAGLVEFPES